MVWPYRARPLCESLNQPFSSQTRQYFPRGWKTQHRSDKFPCWYTFRCSVCPWSAAKLFPCQPVPPLWIQVNTPGPQNEEPGQYGLYLSALPKAIQKALDHGEPYDLVIRFITANGNHLWVRTICRPQIEDGKAVKLMGIFQNITELKQAEEAREKLIGELREALDEIQTLRGIILICANCKKIRDEEGVLESNRGIYSRAFGSPIQPWNLPGLCQRIISWCGHLRWLTELAHNYPMAEYIGFI